MKFLVVLFYQYSYAIPRILKNDISFYGSRDFLTRAKVMGHLEHFYPGFNAALLHVTEGYTTL